MLNVFQSPTQFGNLTVMESGLPSGTQWSVTMTNNGNVFTSTTNSILIQLPYNQTYTFTVSSANSLYTPSPSSFTVNTSLFNLSPSITKSITFNYAIPSPYIQITEYPDDAGLLDQYNVSISYLYNPNNLPPDILTPYYINMTFGINGSTGNSGYIHMSWNWSSYILYIYNISGPTTSTSPIQPTTTINSYNGVQDLQLNIIGPNGKVPYIISTTFPLGMFNLPISSNQYINFSFSTPYTITFVPVGLYPNAGYWSVTITYISGINYGSILSSGTPGIVLSTQTLTTANNGTITFVVFNGSYSYKVTPPQYYYASVNGSGTINVSGANVTVYITFSSVLYTVQTWVSGFMPGETIWINVTGTTIYGFQYSNSSTFVTTNYYSSWGTNLSLYPGLYNFTFAYTQIYQNYTNITASYWGITGSYYGSTPQFSFNSTTLQGSFYLTGSGGLSFMAQITTYNVTIITNLPNWYQIIQYSFTNTNSTLAGIPEYNPSGLAGNTVTVQIPQGIYQIFIGINMQQYQYTAPPVTSYNTTLVVNIYQNTVIYYNFTYIMFNYTINVYSAPTFIQPYQYSIYLNGTCVNGTTLNYSFSGTITSQNYQIQMNLLPGYFSGMFVQYSQFYTPIQVPFTISYQANNIQISLQTNYTPVTLQISGFVTWYSLYIYIQNQTNPIISLNSNSSTQIINVAPFTMYIYSGSDVNSPPDYANGSFYITGPNQTVNIVFLPQQQVTIFLIETGLPTGIQWSATITVNYMIISLGNPIGIGGENTIVQTNSSTSNIIGFSIPYNSNYTIYIQNVTYINTYVPTPNVIQGTVTGQGQTTSPYNIAFSIYTPPQQPPVS
ncbi:MAG: hypothetical protein QW578_08660, partial [Thermoplasmatales archaeon]